jgi:hypothetical protein
MPWFRGGANWRHVGYLDWSAAWDAKGPYLAVILLGLGMFPYLGRRAIAATLAVVPGLLMNLSVERETQYGFGNHYDAQTAPFVMLAAARGMGWLAARAPKLATLRRRIDVWGAYALAVALALVLWDEAGTKTVIQKAEDWLPHPAALAALAEGRATARRYIDAPALTAHHQLGPHIAARPRYFADRSGRGKDEWVAFASTRLRPGHIFIVVRSDALFPSGLAGHLRASGAARLIETGNQIDVWQWPLDAPAPGTPTLREYVARHYREPGGG